MSGRLDNDVHALDPGAIEALRELLGDDREALAELVDAFLDEAPSRLAEFRDGIEHGDAALAGRAAHTLKSNALTFGAHNLAALARDAEAAARDDPPEALRPHADRLDAAWPPVRDALAPLRDGTGP